MGKRELLLIVTFLVVGIGVYRATAPPDKPGQQGFSFSRLFNAIKTEIHGESSQAQVARQASQPIDGSITRLLLPDYRGTVKLIGESREDVSADLQGTAFGMDDATAQARAQAIQIKLSTSGDRITVQVTRPTDARRSRAPELTLRVPSRLLCSLEFRGQAELRGVAEVRLVAARGKVIVRDVGALTGEIQNGGVELFSAREVNLKSTRSEIRIDRVEQALTLEATHGEIRVQRVGGPTKLRIERAQCEVDALAGPATINVLHTNIELRGVTAPVELIGDRSEVEIIMAAAVPITASTSHDELTLELPKGGITLDAVAEQAHVRLPDRDLEVKEGEHEQRVTADIGGGGPKVSLRNEHGDIVVRSGGQTITETHEKKHEKKATVDALEKK